MMNIRKVSAILLAMLMLVSLVGCGQSAPAEETMAPETTEAAVVQTTAATEEASEETEAPAAEEAARPDTDRSGNPLSLPEQVDSIISMAPSTTQTLIDLGLKDKLVAVDTYSAGYFGLEDLPQFDMMEPDTEQMIVLNADLIFTTGMSAASGSDPFQPLRDAGVCIADIPSSSSLDAMVEDMRFIAACVGAEEICETLVADFQAEVDQLAAIGASITDRKTVEVEISAAPSIYAVGSGTFIQEMLDTIGADNIFADQPGYIAASEEEIVSRNPGVVLTTVDYIDDPIGEILGRTGWENVDAVANQMVFQVNNNTVTLANFHLIDGMKQIAKMIYPEAYAEIADPFAAAEAE